MDEKFENDVAMQQSTTTLNAETTDASRSRHWLQIFDIETGGIERVKEDEREEHFNHVWQATTFWASANLAVPTLSTGMLGPVFGLTFWQSFAIIVSVNSVMSACPAWTSIFGLCGLRTTTFTRYAFGYWGNCLVVVFVLVSNVGWAAINAIAGASCWTAVSGGTLPSWAGVIISMFVVWVLSIAGLKWIHRWDTVAWIVPLVVWCVAAGTGAKHFHGEIALREPTSPAAILSFLAVNISWSISWSYLTGDYNVRMPVATPRARLFFCTYLGIALPSILAMTLGAALYTPAVSDSLWAESFATYGVGGPLAKALAPTGGFGKFLLVLAGCSSIPTNIPNGYTFAIAFQNFPMAERVPRTLLVTIGFAISVVVGCFASLSFEDSLTTVLDIVGYWCVILVVVLAEEHLVFRRCSWDRYEWTAWNDPNKLPTGYAGIAAFGIGFVGAALGMSESWYISPVAKCIGGGNVGHELTFSFTAVAFPMLRWLELKAIGR